METGGVRTSAVQTMADVVYGGPLPAQPQARPAAGGLSGPLVREDVEPFDLFATIQGSNRLKAVILGLAELTNHLARRLWREHDNPIVIRNDQIAGVDRDTAAIDGAIDLAVVAVAASEHGRD